MAISPIVILLARACFAAAFVQASVDHLRDLDRTTRTVERAGWPLARIVGIAAFVLALLGALSILAGYHARVGALALIVFLVPATLASHRFWEAPPGEQRTREVQQFMKNLSLIGGALAFVYFGSGPFSVT